MDISAVRLSMHTIFIGANDETNAMGVACFINADMDSETMQTNVQRRKRNEFIVLVFTSTKNL